MPATREVVGHDFFIQNRFPFDRLRTRNFLYQTPLNIDILETLYYRVAS